MALQVDVQADAGKATKELSALEAVLTRIKNLSFNVNIKPGNTAAAATGFESMARSSKVASDSVNNLNRSTQGIASPIGVAEGRFRSFATATTNAKNKQVELNNAIVSTATSASRLESIVQKSTNRFNELAASAASILAVALSVKAALSVLDGATNMTTQLSLATNSTQGLNLALKQTRAIAMDTRSGLTEVSTLYAKLANATRDYGTSQRDIATLTSTVSKAVQMSGSSAESSAAAIMQLGQALGSSVLQGDELRSILENAPALAKAIADGLGVSVNNLREMGKAGELSSKSIIDALLSQADNVNAKFRTAGITYAQAFNKVGQSVQLLGLEFQKAFSDKDSKTIPAYINDIGDAIARLAERVGYRIMILKTEFFIMMERFKTFMAMPFELKLSAIKLKLNDVLPSYSDLRGYAATVGSTIMSSLASAYSSVSSLIKGNSVRGYATGGHVDGPGTSTSDSIPAMLSRGEFVVKASAASKNIGMLHAINNGAAVSHFASGGDTVKGRLQAFTDDFSVAAKDMGYAIKDMAASFMDSMPTFKDFVAQFKSITRTGPYIGGGPQSERANRSVTHDMINTFIPEGLQRPAIIALGVAVGGIGFWLTRTNDILSKFVLGAAAFGTERAITNYTGPAISAENQANIFESLLKALRVGTDFVFGKPTGTNTITETGEITKGIFEQGLFGERGFGGVIVSLTRIALLFAAGRSLIGGGLLNIATAPTRLVNSQALAFQARGAEKDYKKSQAGLDAYDKRLEKLKEDLNNSKQTQKETQKALAGLKFNGANIGAVDAAAIARGRQPGAYNAATMMGTLPKDFNALSTAAVRARENLAAATIGMRQYTQTAEDLHKKTRAQTEQLKKDADGLRGRVDEAKAKSKEAFIGGGSAIGGALGSLVGFNIGTNIAEGMNNSSSSLQRSMVILGTTLGVQAAGSLAATFLASMTVWVAGSFSSMLGATFAKAGALVAGAIASSSLALPIAIGAAILGAIAGAIYLWNNTEFFQKELKAWQKLGETWALELSKVFTNLFPTWFTDKMKANALSDSAADATKYATTDQEKRDANAKSQLAALFQASVDNADVGGAGLPAVYLKQLKEQSTMALQGYSGDKTGAVYLDAEKRFKKIFADIDKELEAYDKSAARLSKTTTTIAENFDKVNKSVLASKGINTDGTIGGQATVGVDTKVFKDFFSITLVDAIKSVGNIFNNIMAPGADAYAPVKKATGGFVDGPGTTTSDSIPAMLSKKEFVVNAKDAERNADILRAINSGQAVSYFSDGGSPVEFVPNSRYADPKKFKRASLVGGMSTIDSIVAAIKDARARGVQISDDDAMMFLKNTLVENRKDLGSNGITVSKGYDEAFQFNTIPKYTSSLLATLFDKRLSDIKPVNVVKSVDRYNEYLEAFRDLEDPANAVLLSKVKANKRGARLINNLLSLRDEIGTSREAFNKKFFSKSYEQTHLSASTVGVTPASFALFHAFVKMNENRQGSLSELFESGRWNGQGKVTMKSSDGTSRTVADSENHVKKLHALEIPENQKLFDYFKASLNRKATGGFIDGPGTTTSDSIPAMLSRKEFVVNAAAAEKNADILHAINSGQSVRYFWQGSGGGRLGDLKAYQATQPRTYSEDLSRYKDLTSQYDELFDKFETMYNLPKNILRIIAKHESGFNPDIVSPANNNGTRDYGLMQHNSRFLAERGLTEDWNKPARAIEEAAKLLAGNINRTGSIEAGVAAYNGAGERARSYGSFVMDALQQSGTAITGAAATTAAVVREAAAPLVEAIEGPWDRFIKSLEAMIRSTKMGGEALDWMKGMIENLKSMIQPKTDYNSKISTNFEDYAEKLRDLFVNQSITKDAISSMPIDKLSKLGQLVNEAFENQKTNNALPDTADNEVKKTMLEGQRFAILDAVSSLFDKDSSNKPAAPFEGISLKGTEEDVSKFNAAIVAFNTSISDGTFKNLKPRDFDELEEILTKIRSLGEQKIGADVNKKDRIDAEIKTLQEYGNSVLLNAEEATRKAAAPFSKTADAKLIERNLGEMRNAFSSGMSEVLKGKSSFKDFAAMLLDRFTSSIIETFVKGFTDDLFGKALDDPLSKIFGNANIRGSDIATGADSRQGIVRPLNNFFGDVKKMFGWNTDAEKMSEAKTSFRRSEIAEMNTPDISAKVTDIVGESVDGLGATLKNAFSGAGSMFSNLLGNLFSGSGSIWTSIIGLFGFAEGGHVRGPGSGTSDSIPAMLSNGEFVVNSKATAKYGDLLERLNSGDMPRFATGGYVDRSALMTFNSGGGSRKTAAKQQSIFNINVTGDVSMQTRREIQQMIPQIASGVNMHNYEQGIRA